MNFTIERKRKKNASIRIENDGRIIVSVPLYFSDADIDNFIQKYDSWIKKHLNNAVDETLQVNIKEGEAIYILGDAYSIEIIPDNKNYSLINGGFLEIHTKSMDQSKIEKVYADYIKELSIDVYTKCLNKYLSLTGLNIKSLKIKSMKRALGKCYYERGEIILNSSLIHKNIKYIEAVVMHEVAHLKYPNHQKEFYDYINEFMPDYKERMKNKI